MVLLLIFLFYFSLLYLCFRWKLLTDKKRKDHRPGFKREEKTLIQINDLRIYLIYLTPYMRSFSENPSTGYGTCYAPSFNNGNLAGIQDSLSYIKAMGYNAIWITPVMDSDAGTPNSNDEINLKLDATGYFFRDCWQIDPLFGSLKEYQTLVGKAHELEMYVIWDIALGHNKGNLPPSPRGLTVPNQLDFTVPSTVDYFTELLVYWIQLTEIDGFRFDVAYQIPLSAWNQILDALNSVFSLRRYSGYQFGILGFVVGEVLCTGYLTFSNGLGSCDASSTVSLDLLENNIIYMLQSLPIVFNFPLFFRVRQCLAHIDFQNQPVETAPTAKLIAEGYAWSEQNKISTSRLCMLFNNHDNPRFGNLLIRSGLVKGLQDPDYWKRHKLFFAFLASYSGPIHNFYLDEVGTFTPGFANMLTTDQRCLELNLCDDESGRVNGRTEGFTYSERDLQSYVLSLWMLRDQYSILSSGNQTILQATEVFVALKSSTTETTSTDLLPGSILFLMNISRYPQPINPTLWNYKSYEIIHSSDSNSFLTNSWISRSTVTLAPLSAVFLLLK